MPAYHTIFYGGRGCEEAAIFGAIACASRGERVALIGGDYHIGGMTAGGLVAQDRGKPARRLRGLYLTFVRLLGLRMGAGSSLAARAHIAERVFHQMIGEAGRKSGGRVDLYLNDPIVTVTRSGAEAGNPITSVTTASGKVFTAWSYIDGSRSLMMIQRAGAQGELWTIGRESAAAFGESLGGYGVVRTVRTGQTHDPDTGALLSGLSPAPGTAIGAADAACQAPVYRSLITDDAQSRMAFDHVRVDLTTYNRKDHLLAAQLLSGDGTIRGYGIAPGISAANGDALLTDALGAPLHWTYDLKTDAEQIAIEALYKRQHQHFNYFVMTDAMFAGTRLQASYQSYGWVRDEFGTDGFPWALYRRSGVRFIGNYMMQQQDLQVTDVLAARNIYKTNAVAIGGYDIDHHSYQFHLGAAPGTWVMEGGAQPPDKWSHDQGYCIPYSSLVTDVVPNLGSAWPSCTNAAAGSIRIILNLCFAGIALGYAAAIARQTGVALNAVPVASVQALLVAAGYRTTVGPWTSDPDDDDDGDGIPNDEDDDDDGDGIPDTEEEDDEG